MKSSKSPLKLYITSVLCIIIGIFLDQYTKFLAVTHLIDAPIPIIDGVFELHYLENRGAAFGMLQNQQWFFLITGTILLVLVAIVYTRLPYTKRILPLRICMILVTAGAIGNMIDRIRLKTRIGKLPESSFPLARNHISYCWFLRYRRCGYRSKEQNAFQIRGNSHPRLRWCRERSHRQRQRGIRSELHRQR